MPTSPSNQHAPNTSKLTQHTNQLAPHSQQSLPSSSSSSSPSKSSSASSSHKNTTVHQFSSWRISAWSVLIFVVALNLRPSIAAVGPVLQQTGTTFGYTPATLVILTAIPMVAFAAASPLVTPLASRLGSDHTMLIALLAIAVGNAMRTFGTTPGLWLGTVLFSSAMADAIWQR